MPAHVCECVYVCAIKPMWLSEDSFWVTSLFLLCTSLELNLGLQAWQQSPAEPSCWPFSLVATVRVEDNTGMEARAQEWYHTQGSLPWKELSHSVTCQQDKEQCSLMVNQSLGILGTEWVARGSFICGSEAVRPPSYSDEAFLQVIITVKSEHLLLL